MAQAGAVTPLALARAPSSSAPSGMLHPHGKGGQRAGVLLPLDKIPDFGVWEGKGEMEHCCSSGLIFSSR